MERDKGVYLAVLLGKSSMRWLTKTVDEMIRGDETWDFCRTFRMGNSMNAAHQRVNSHGRFLEVMEYDAGWRSFIIIPESRE